GVIETGVDRLRLFAGVDDQSPALTEVDHRARTLTDVADEREPVRARRSRPHPDDHRGGEDAAQDDDRQSAHVAAHRHPPPADRPPMITEAVRTRHRTMTGSPHRWRRTSIHVPPTATASRAAARTVPTGGVGQSSEAPGREAQPRATPTIHHAGRDPNQARPPATMSGPGRPVVAIAWQTRLRKPATVAGRTAGAARALAATDHRPMRGSMATSTGVQASWATKGTMRAATRTDGSSGRWTASRRSRIGTTNMIAVVETTDRTNPTEVARTGTNASSRL